MLDFTRCILYTNFITKKGSHAFFLRKKYQQRHYTYMYANVCTNGSVFGFWTKKNLFFILLNVMRIVRAVRVTRNSSMTSARFYLIRYIYIHSIVHYLFLLLQKNYAFFIRG